MGDDDMETTITNTVEYHKGYFVDAPRKHGRSDWSNTLLLRRTETRAYATGRTRSAVRTDAIEFTGATQDEADQKMIAWIEANNATECDMDTRTR